MRKALLLGSFLLTSGQAAAGDKPLYQPPPAWVKAAPAIDPATLNDASPILLTFDHQDRLHDGGAWSYADIATRLASPEVVAQAGTLSVPWNPAKGDLIVHRVEILRGRQVIDVLAAGRRFDVIRREQQLEQRQLDGQLTATMPIEGLQVGDVLHIVVSITRQEPAFGRQTQTMVGLPQAPVRVGYARARVLWPAAADVKWRVYAEGRQGQVALAGADRELVVEGALPKPADLPDDAPLRFRTLPLVEASTFADWGAVSRTMAPLYTVDGAIKPGGALAGEVAQIAAATTDPTRRVAAALQLVQEKVRYLFNGLGNGNFVPQSPEQTWALRYGDCKAKTLLLLAVLHQLGVEAEPVLAATNLGDMLPARLPGPGAFDHVLVRAVVGGETLWLDGTGRGARYADVRDTPPLRWVLPVRTAGASLLQVPARAPAHPTVAVALDLDQRTGIGMPTLVHAVVTLRGPIAEMVGLAKNQGSKEQKDQAVGQMIGEILSREVALSSYSLDYDPAAAVATVDARGLASQLWVRRDGRYRLTLDRTVDTLQFEPDRARAAWRALPVATGIPDAQEMKLRVQLPTGLAPFTLEGDSALSETLAGTHITRSAALASGVVSMTQRAERDGAEIAATDVAAVRARLTLAKSRSLTVIAPGNLPSRAIWVQEGRRHGRFKPMLAAYAAAIAANPEEVFAYANRAAFLLGTFDWKAALADFDRILSLAPTARYHLKRAEVLLAIGEEAKALADLRAARALDPASVDAVDALARLLMDNGKKDEALARAQEQIDAGGSGRAGHVVACFAACASWRTRCRVAGDRRGRDAEAG